ncbi:MAG: Rieske 2Fe-2S domain-containing protein [Anaerolineae bacterium]|jgi:nitrite reductase/ring-hydroxylating ferredoxin subunit
MRTINRREFIKLTGAAALCTCAGAAGLCGCSNSGGASNIPAAPQGCYRRQGDQVIVSLAAAGPLNPVGGAVRVTLGGGEEADLRMVVVHAQAETYRAFADCCTHNGKELDYLPEAQKLQCRSGQAQFDLDGKVLRGPAERALRVYPTRREGDQLLIAV